MTVGQQGGSDDTPEGCRERADQDRARAEAMDTGNGRIRLQRSAAAWEARAAELDGLAETRDARRAAAIIEWDEGERASRNEREDYEDRDDEGG